MADQKTDSRTVIKDRNLYCHHFRTLVNAFDTKTKGLKSVDRNKFEAIKYLKFEPRYQVFKDQYVMLDVCTGKKTMDGLYFIKRAEYFNAIIYIFRVDKTQYLEQVALVFDAYMD
jgi:hypothetical protein